MASNHSARWECKKKKCRFTLRRPPKGHKCPECGTAMVHLTGGKKQ